MVLEALFFSPLIQLTRLVAQEYFIMMNGLFEKDVPAAEVVHRRMRMGDD
jgi:hypothetical protein